MEYNQGFPQVKAFGEGKFSLVDCPLWLETFNTPLSLDSPAFIDYNEVVTAYKSDSRPRKMRELFLASLRNLKATSYLSQVVEVALQALYLRAIYPDNWNMVLFANTFYDVIKKPVRGNDNRMTVIYVIHIITRVELHRPMFFKNASRKIERLYCDTFNQTSLDVHFRNYVSGLRDFQSKLELYSISLLWKSWLASTKIDGNFWRKQGLTDYNYSLHQLSDDESGKSQDSAFDDFTTNRKTKNMTNSQETDTKGNEDATSDEESEKSPDSGHGEELPNGGNEDNWDETAKRKPLTKPGPSRFAMQSTSKSSKKEVQPTEKARAVPIKVPRKKVTRPAVKQSLVGMRFNQEDPVLDFSLSRVTQLQLSRFEGNTLANHILKPELADFQIVYGADGKANAVFTYVEGKI